MHQSGSIVKFSLAALLLGGIIVSGCGGGEGGGEGGSAGAQDTGSLSEAASDSLAKMRMVLAKVGDIEITGADVRNHMLKRSSPQDVDKYLKGTGRADILQVAVASLMDQYVWSETAKREGYELDQDDQHQVRAFESELLATRYVGDVVQGKSEPTRDEIEEYYQQNQSKYMSPYRSAVRHILVKTQAEAERLEKEAEGGADFTDLARKYSLDDQTKDFGGALGYVQTGKPVLGMGRDAAFTQALMALDQGEYGVIKSDRGWHVVYVEKKEGGDMIPLEKVYDDIEQQFIAKRFGKVYNKELSAAREATDAHFITENFEKFTSSTGNTNRLLHLAHEMQDMGGRIEAYRRLSYDFPNSAEAAEAQFYLAYLAVTALQDDERAEIELSRLRRKFSRSQWRKAGEWLKQHMYDPVESIPSPQEILEMSR